jgi:hypothetical protein
MDRLPVHFRIWLSRNLSRGSAVKWTRSFDIGWHHCHCALTAVTAQQIHSYAACSRRCDRWIHPDSAVRSSTSCPADCHSCPSSPPLFVRCVTDSLLVPSGLARFDLQLFLTFAVLKMRCMERRVVPHQQAEAADGGECRQPSNSTYRCDHCSIVLTLQQILHDTIVLPI